MLYLWQILVRILSKGLVVRKKFRLVEPNLASVTLLMEYKQAFYTNLVLKLMFFYISKYYSFLFHGKFRESHREVVPITI